MNLEFKSSRLIASVVFSLVVAITATADTVTDWNRIATQEVVIAARPGATGVLDMATVQVAVYDAVQAIVKEYRPYHVIIPGASGSPSSAAAKAARDVLVNRFPGRTGAIDAIYQQYLMDHGLNPADPGVGVGETAAAGIIALRSADGSFPLPAPPPFVGSTAVGVWRPTLPAFAPMISPWLGSVTPSHLMLLRSSAQQVHRT